MRSSETLSCRTVVTVAKTVPLGCGMIEMRGRIIDTEDRADFENAIRVLARGSPATEAKQTIFVATMERNTL